MREGAVVGEQQQSLAVGVEPADVEDPLAHTGQQLGDAGAAALVDHGRDDAAGLVRARYTSRVSATTRSPSTYISDGGRVGPVARAGRRGPSTLTRPSRDQLLAQPPRADPGCGHDLLQPLRSLRQAVGRGRPGLAALPEVAAATSSGQGRSR